jgi:hypothetical protein
VRAFKFLLDGQLAPFSGLRWAVGEWVASTGPAACRSGIHACAPADLPFWLMDELWEVELAGSVTRGQHKLVAERGRLVRRVHAWDPAAREEFAQACVTRVRELARRRPEAEEHLADLASWAPHVRAAAVASLAARAFEAVEGRDGYDAERTAQTHWVLEQLALPA